MAKIFYIHLKDEKQVMGYFFNDKRKAEKEGSGINDDFEFGLNGVTMGTPTFGRKDVYSGEIDIKKGLLFYRERLTGEVKMEDMSEEDAKSILEEIDGVGAYFPAKLKSGQSNAYIKRQGVNAKGALWSFYYGNILENKKMTMKYVKLFEQFINESKVNKGKIHKAAKQASYPVTLVVIDGKEVCHQELVETPMAVPAAVSVLKDKYPNCKIHVESKDGEVVFVQEGLTKDQLRGLAYLHSEQDPRKIKDLQKAIGKDFSDNFSSTLRSMLVDVKKKKDGTFVAIVKEHPSKYNDKKPKKGEKEMSIGLTWNAMFY